MNFDQILSLPPEIKALCLAGIAFGVFVIIRAALQRFKKVRHEELQYYRVVLSIFARETKPHFGVISSLYIGVAIFFRDEKWFTIAHRFFLIVLMIQVWNWASYFVEIFFERKKLQLSPGDLSKATSFKALGFIANLLLLLFICLFTLDNFGVNISALVAGLGVGGIAIALAVQSILSDLFASVTIILDKPFVVGDAITVGEFSGKIENIGVKTTRIRSISGEQVIFSNADLLQSRIRNFKHLYERRVLLKFGIAYETPLDVVAEVPTLLKEIISKFSDLRFERAHFASFGASSLDFEVVYFVLSSEYEVYMDRQQEINLSLARSFLAKKIDFAYPTTTVRLFGQAASETRTAP